MPTQLLAICLSIILNSINSNFDLANTQIKTLPDCLVITHCVRKVIPVNDVEKSFNRAVSIVSRTPRTKVVELGDDYIHAEATTKWMHYVDDLEIRAVPNKSILIVRSESRVGVGDMGVNKKRVDDFENHLREEDI